MMTIFQIIEYVEQKGSRKARIIEMLKQYSIETIWFGEQIYNWTNTQENRLSRTALWASIIQERITDWLWMESWAPFGVSISDSFYWLESWAYRTAWWSPRVVVGDPEGEYTTAEGGGGSVYVDTSYYPVSHTNKPGDMLNVPNTQRIEIGEQTDYSSIDVF